MDSFTLGSSRYTGDLFTCIATNCLCTLHRKTSPHPTFRFPWNCLHSKHTPICTHCRLLGGFITVIIAPFFSLFVLLSACVSESLQTAVKQVRVHVWLQPVCVTLVFTQRKEFHKDNRSSAEETKSPDEAASSPCLTCPFPLTLQFLYY